MANPTASFCACCADQGAWRQERYELNEYEQSGLAQLKFQTARLHLTVADFPEGITASETSLDDDFSLAVTRTAQRWAFTLTTRHGETVKLRLSLPRAATLYGTDISSELTLPGFTLYGMLDTKPR